MPDDENAKTELDPAESGDTALGATALGTRTLGLIFRSADSMPVTAAGGGASASTVSIGEISTAADGPLEGAGSVWLLSLFISISGPRI